MFTHEIGIARHQSTHIGEKPYKCDQCDNYSAQKYYLLTYQTTHSGDKSFRCDKCDKCFSNKD